MNTAMRRAGRRSARPCCAVRSVCPGARLLAGALAAVLALFCGAEPVSAHVADTSYARFKVARDGIESKFSFDFATLARIAPGLDADADHRVTPAELAAKAPAVYAYLRQRIRFEIDGVPADFGAEQPVAYPPDADPAGVPEARFHDAASLTHFTFRHPLARPPADFWVQFELFHELGSRHTVLGAIDEAGQKHDVLFSESEPDYLFDTGYGAAREAAAGAAPGAGSHAARQPPPAGQRPIAEREPAGQAPQATPESKAGSPAEPAPRARRTRAEDSAWRQMGRYLGLGVEHIFLGFDHILFLLSLLLMSRFRELVKIVTSFTVAHTITLMLATLDAVRLPSRLVESAIAATIVYVAVENFWVRETAHRWRLTFFCGLIHGFGFAGVLQELGLPTEGLVRSLVAFNLGVEVGQLIIVAAIFPLSLLLARWRYSNEARLAISGAIALCGAGWLVDRALGLGWMPF